jgi:P27 family predicted phage terminase small subunit
MRTGRPPLAKGLHELHGNPSRKRLDDIEDIQTRGPLGPPPACLDTATRGVWHELEAVMPVAILASCDLPSVTCYVQAVSQHRHAVVELRRTGGAVIHGAEGPRANPWARVVDRQALLLLRLASELGLTPTARAAMAARIAQAGGSTEQPRRDALAEYLSRKPDRLPS